MTELYPAHDRAWAYGGVFLRPKPVSTSGFERHWNRFVQLDDPEAFVHQILMLIKPPIAEAATIRAENLGQTDRG